MMNVMLSGEERREIIWNKLQESKTPISGGMLAKELGVSRQVIVQDMALLRAEKNEISSTNRGYILEKKEKRKYQRCIEVYHTAMQTRDELYSIVDAGARVLDVMVNHPVYGAVRGNLVLQSREDVDAYMKKMDELRAVPLRALTANEHYHTIEADSMDVIKKAMMVLRIKGFILNK